MKPYGIKKNWNVWEDYVRNGRAYRIKTHRKCMKIMKRRERRLTRLKYKLIIYKKDEE